MATCSLCGKTGFKNMNAHKTRSHTALNVQGVPRGEFWHDIRVNVGLHGGQTAVLTGTASTEWQIMSSDKQVTMYVKQLPNRLPVFSPDKIIEFKPMRCYDDTIYKSGKVGGRTYYYYYDTSKCLPQTKPKRKPVV